MEKTNDVEVILVGNELLKGERRDTHLAFIGRVLARVGVRVGGAHVVGDDRARIAAIIRDRLDEARVLIVSGGLGPTHDDVTREGVADGVGEPLEFRLDQWRVIEEIFKQFGRKAEESNRRQAYFPKGAEPIPNPAGTAAGFTVEACGCLVAVLPGPPRELRPMLEDTVLARVDGIFGRPGLFTETFRTTGIAESTMYSIVQPIFEAHDEFIVSSLPGIGGVDIVITPSGVTTDRASLEERALSFENALRETLGNKLYGKGDVTLEAVIGERLAERGATISLAESLTGGLIGKQLTDVPGSSRYFLVDVVAYGDEAKTSFLDVKAGTLKKHGAVSEAVCKEMAEGIRKRTGSTFGLATTGIAGPGGGTKRKPTGLTYYGLSWDGGASIRNRVFPGGREEVRHRVAYAALYLVHDKLRSV